MVPAAMERLGLPLTQDHVPGFHGDIMSFSVMTNNFKRPWFLHISVDADDC